MHVGFAVVRVQHKEIIGNLKIEYFYVENIIHGYLRIAWQSTKALSLLNLR